VEGWVNERVGWEKDVGDMGCMMWNVEWSVYNGWFGVSGSGVGIWMFVDFNGGDVWTYGGK
jgi:hypothetical protein